MSFSNTLQTVKDGFFSCFNKLRGKKNKSDDEDKTIDLEATGATDAEGNTAGGVDNASLVINDEGDVKQGSSFCPMAHNSVRPERPAPQPPSQQPSTTGNTVNNVNVPPPQLDVQQPIGEANTVNDLTNVPLDDADNTATATANPEDGPVVAAQHGWLHSVGSFLHLTH